MTLSNHDRAFGIDAPFFDAQGKPLAGTNYLAQLYAGTTSNALVAVAPAVQFTTNGYLRATNVVTPWVDMLVWVGVRAWDATDGAPTYEQAAVDGRWTGLSNILLVSLPGPACDPPCGPAPLIGLRFLGTPNPPLPAITGQPHNQAVLPGATVTFAVGATNGLLTYQWRFDSQELAGQTNDTLVLTRVKVTQTGQYDVIVSNPSGSTPSLAATLTITIGPGTTAILGEPSDQNVRPGERAALAVAASGDPPPFYQWYQGLSGDTNQPLAGATNAVYLTEPLTTNATFWVNVSNGFGSLDSPTVSVNVFPAKAARLAAQVDSSGVRLSLDGQVGTTYRIDYSTNLLATNWLTLRTVSLSATPLTVLDTEATNAPRRFYRAVVP